MAIQIEFYTLLIKRSPLVDDYFKDKISIYDNWNGSDSIGPFRYDDYLLATGAMGMRDLEDDIKSLLELNLKEEVDFLIVTFFTEKSDSHFISYGKIDGIYCCWLKGTLPGEIKSVKRRN